MGETLRKARQDKGLSVQQVADAIRISPAYLEALEQDRLDPFPAVVYARGFLKSYASYLGLAAEPLLDEFQALCDPDELTSELSRRRYPRNSRSPAVAATISRRYAGASASGFFPTDYAQQRRGRSRRSALNLPIVLAAVLMLILWMAYSHGLMSRFLGVHPNSSAKSSNHGVTHPNRAPALKPPTTPPAGHISLGLRATGYVHCMVNVDGNKKPIFNGEWMPGEHAIFVGQSHISLFADRGNNVVAAFNGKDLGPLSTERHQVWLTFPLPPKPAPSPGRLPSAQVAPHLRPGPSGTTWAARGPALNGSHLPQAPHASVDADASTRLSTL